MPSTSLTPDPGLAQVLSELHPAEPVVQWVSRVSLLILGGSYNVGASRVFIPTDLVLDTSMMSLSPVNYAFPMSVELDVAGSDTSIPPGSDCGIYLGDDGRLRILRYAGDDAYMGSNDSVRLRCLGGYHTLCYDVGLLGMRPSSVYPDQNHPLSAFIAGDILPQSVWAFNFRPDCPDPTGMVYISETNTWIDIYPASGSMSNPKSVFSYNPSAFGQDVIRRRTSGHYQTVYVDLHASYSGFMTGFAAVGKRLPYSDEFYFAALGSNCRSVAPGPFDDKPYDEHLDWHSTYMKTGGWLDTKNERMVSSIGCEAMCGLVNHWLQERYLPQDGGYANTEVAGGGTNSEGMYASGASFLLAGGSYEDAVNGTPVSGPLCRRVVKSDDAFTAGYTTVGARGVCPCRQTAR